MMKMKEIHEVMIMAAGQNKVLILIDKMHITVSHTHITEYNLMLKYGKLQIM